METSHKKSMRELDWQIRSNRPLIFISTFEENRVCESIKFIAKRSSDEWGVFYWDLATGLQTNPNFEHLLPPKPKNLNHIQVLEWFRDLKDETHGYYLLVLKDYLKIIHDEATLDDKRGVRMLRNMSHDLISQHKTVIMLGTSLTLPEDLNKACAVIDWPLPEYEYINEKVSNVLEQAKKNNELIKKGFKVDYSETEIQDVIRAFQGLTLQEIELLCTYMMVSNINTLDPVKIASVKREIIRKTGLLDWIDVNENVEEVGGLKGIKHWLQQRKFAFTTEAKDYGLPGNPKGILFVGVQGAGKSLMARCVASFWQLPLIRLDMGKIFSGIVGSSEENIRTAIKIAESVSPSILWMDELDKGMSGSASSNQTDGGTASRVLGSFLTWMQEKESPVLVVATANDVSQLPPEILRKGRFDEIFFVDLPSEEERLEIFKIHLAKRKRDPFNFDLDLLVDNSASFTGAEIEAAIISAMYEAFDDNKRDFKTEDILNAIDDTVPLAVTMKEQIDGLRSWANKRARHASKLKKRKIKDQEIIDTVKALMENVSSEEDEEL
jgi:SpoVK/Ycf46/Vps4 family AAA+-type ATPase